VSIGTGFLSIFEDYQILALSDFEFDNVRTYSLNMPN
jgi:hypothetical protein